MQHSHEAMTYQDEVIDEHEPAEKNTLHNGCPFSFNSLRLQHHFQLTRALENFDDFLPTTFSTLIRKNKMLLSVTDRIIVDSNFSNSKKLKFNHESSFVSLWSSSLILFSLNSNSKSFPNVEIVCLFLNRKKMDRFILLLHEFFQSSFKDLNFRNGPN